jgi:predicted RNase H-like HicB family nuclease
MEAAIELPYTYWEADEGGYLGYINQYPEYWTQGETVKELEEMLVSLYEDIIPNRVLEQPHLPGGLYAALSVPHVLPV